MLKPLICLLSISSLSAGAFADIALVVDGKPNAEIVLADDASPSVKVSATELQKHLEAMSGARLPIVSKVSSDIPNHVYIGQSEETKKLGFSLDDVKYDGFKIVAEKNHAIVAGKEFYTFEELYSRMITAARSNHQKLWEEFTGRKWRKPGSPDVRDYSKELGFHVRDGTGTLYATYGLLEQLGMRWYAPIPELGIITPKLKDITIKDQNLKREPEFAVRNFTDCKVGTSIIDEFLWYKAIGIGGDHLVPAYHTVSGPTKLHPEQQPQEYYGKIKGKINYKIPRLNSERLRADMVEYLNQVDKYFPGTGYISLGQPDGWSQIDSEDVAAGWDKSAERGATGRFSDYAWDFNLDMRKRLMTKHPDKKFTVFAYTVTSRVPSSLDKVPANMVVCFTQTSAYWMVPDMREQLTRRNEWLSRMNGKDQLYIWEYYLQHADRYNAPPAPIIFPKLMKMNFDGLYDRAIGFEAEIGWKNKSVPGEPVMARPWLSHIMLYLHQKLSWDRNADIDGILNEYYTLFYGPASAEMKEFFEFSESVWMRPEPRQITANGGFLKPADVEKYFAILDRAQAKAGDTVYGKRIAGIRGEMASLAGLFDNLQRKGPNIKILNSKMKPTIDGDLEKAFWTENDPKGYHFRPLREMRTGAKPKDIKTTVSFRWLKDDSALMVGIECFEPNMDRLVATAKDPDSPAIFADDMVEIRLETSDGIRPMIGINSNGVVYDECITQKLEDLPLFYTVGEVAVKKYADRWTAEVRIDASALNGRRPTPSYPWGVNICRQRMAGDEPEHYMLSPSGTNFREPTSMANIFARK